MEFFLNVGKNPARYLMHTQGCRISFTPLHQQGQRNTTGFHPSGNIHIQSLLKWTVKSSIYFQKNVY